MPNVLHEDAAAVGTAVLYCRRRTAPCHPHLLHQPGDRCTERPRSRSNCRHTLRTPFLHGYRRPYVVSRAADHVPRSPKGVARRHPPGLASKYGTSVRAIQSANNQRVVFGEMNLSEIVRSGAQMMLQYALEREVTEALGRSYYANAPETTKEKGRRNGNESHRVLTGEGAVTVQVPQVRETERGFSPRF